MTSVNIRHERTRLMRFAGRIRVGDMRKSGAMLTEKTCNNCNCFDYRVLVCCNEKSRRAWDFVDPLMGCEHWQQLLKGQKENK